MPLTNSKLNQMYPRHGAWIASMPKAEAETCFKVAEDLAEKRRNLSWKSAGELLEKAGLFEAAWRDPYAHKMLALAKSAGMTLTENGWVENKQ